VPFILEPFQLNNQEQHKINEENHAILIFQIFHNSVNFHFLGKLKITQTSIILLNLSWKMEEN
jgi:hypothetical protein